MLLDPETIAPALCSAWLFLQSAVISEGARQPFSAQVNIARAARNVACDYTQHSYLAGLRVAATTRDGNNHHYRAYTQRWETFPADVVLRAAEAAHIALSEEPPVVVRHFVRKETLPGWWAGACHEEWEDGDHAFCR